MLPKRLRQSSLKRGRFVRAWNSQHGSDVRLGRAKHLMRRRCENVMPAHCSVITCYGVVGDWLRLFSDMSSHLLHHPLKHTVIRCLLNSFFLCVQPRYLYFHLYLFPHHSVGSLWVKAEHDNWPHRFSKLNIFCRVGQRNHARRLGHNATQSWCSFK